jgi:hypothetical protein
MPTSHAIRPPVPQRVTPRYGERPHAHVCPSCLIDFVCTDEACAVLGTDALWLCPGCDEKYRPAPAAEDRAAPAEAEWAEARWAGPEDY